MSGTNMLDDSVVLTRHIAALNALIDDMRANGNHEKSISISDGKRIGRTGGKSCYAFLAPAGAWIQADTELSLEISGSRYECDLISANASQLQLALDVDCGVVVRKAKLWIDQLQLLTVLLERLRSVEKGELTFFNRNLAESVSRNVDVKTAERTPEGGGILDLNKDQQDAIRIAFQNSVSFLWGPPGTGKTATLSIYAKLLLDSPLRLLICSTTNRAVDQVLLKLCSTLGPDHPAIQDSQIIRTGTIQLQELREKWADMITPGGICDGRAAELRSKKEKLDLRLHQVRADAGKCRTILHDFDKAEALGRELAQSQKKLDSATEDCERARHERESAAFQLRRVFEELQNVDNTATFLRWLKRPRQQILSELGLRRSCLLTAESQVIKTDEQRQRLDLLIANQRRTLEQSLSRLQASDRIQTRQKYEELSQEISRVSSLIKELTETAGSPDEQEILQRAKIVSATIAKIYRSPRNFSNFDVIVIDEACMVLQPALYFVAGLGGKNVVISGDFRQLPPIVASKSREIADRLGRDIFQDSGVADALVGLAPTLPNAVMLRDQYRMADPICQLISKRIYAGKLKTAADRRSKEFRGLFPVIGPYHILDTSAVRPFQQRDKTNFLHVAAVTLMVQRLAGAGVATSQSKVGVCSPFRPQADSLLDSLKRAGLDKVSQVGTVHTFQGDESDVIIFDTRDGANLPRPSEWLCASSPAEVGARMLNVAFSRARECLVIVANLDYLQSQLPTNSILAGVMAEIMQRGTVIDVRDFLGDHWLPQLESQSSGGLHPARPRVFDSSGFSTEFLSDLEQSCSEVIIYSGYITPERVSQYLDVFRRKRGQVRIRCVTRPPSQNGSISIERGERALRDLESVGCSIARKPNLHEKVAVIDRRLVWCGSLNPLSHSDRTSEIMMRYDDPDLAMDVLRFLRRDSRAAASGSRT